MFFFQILYSASIRRSSKTSDTSLLLALAVAAAVPVMVALVILSFSVDDGNDNKQARGKQGKGKRMWRKIDLAGNQIADGKGCGSSVETLL